MIEKDLIKTTKNLLAFSGGVDSSALFFLLLENNIQFDICIIDYNQREQSKLEVTYAQELSYKYNKECYLVDYESNKFNEKIARDFRYEAFFNIISKHQYQSLITAHQLNDKFEWFLMQLSKGAGLSELIGLHKVEQRDNFILYRPLLDISKEELLDYLDKNKLQYFIDETNNDTKYKRNLFRKEFSNNFITSYKDGLRKSFEYLEKDIQSLENKFEAIKFNELIIFQFTTLDENSAIRAIDKELKKRGILISKKTRDEILIQKSIIISHKVAVEITKNSIWIAPFIQSNMDKKFKELCRVTKIPKYVRPYLCNFYIEDQLPDFLIEIGK